MEKTINHKIQRLTKVLYNLPGIGPKMAERLAYHLLKSDKNELDELINSLIDLKSGINFCQNCLSPTESHLCNICSDTMRNHYIICVVETVQDLFAIEKTKKYNGLYHILGGSISPLDGIGPDNLNLNKLLPRINDSVKELIIATNPTTEGDITANYIKQLLQDKVKVTRIGFGLPMGGSLEYADEITISRSLESRKEI